MLSNTQNHRNNISPFENITVVFSYVLFLLLLLKFSGVRIWPHLYAGDVLQSNKLDFFIEKTPTGITLMLFFMNIDFFISLFRRYFFIFVFLIYSLSVSMIQNVTDKAFTLFTVFGYWESFIGIALFLRCYGNKAINQVLTRFAFIFVLINIASYAVPSYSIMVGNELAGFFRGLTAHRNDLAQVTTISLYFLIFLKNNIPSLYRWIGILLGIVLIALAGSVQGVLLLSLGIFIYLLVNFKRFVNKNFFIIGIVIILLAISIFLSFYSLDEFLGFFGRDTSFTGRDRIWNLSLFLLDGMPWQGYGLGSIFNSVSDGTLEDFELGTLFNTVHNSYLEAILSFGWIGGTLFILVALNVIYLMIKNIINHKNLSVENMLPFVMILFSVIGGLTSSEKFFLPLFGWFTFILAIFLAQKPVKNYS